MGSSGRVGAEWYVGMWSAALRALAGWSTATPRSIPVKPPWWLLLRFRLLLWVFPIVVLGLSGDDIGAAMRGFDEVGRGQSNP